MGLFILSISLAMFEGWLNYTSYIFRFLWLSNFAEPLNFVMAGLLYLFIAAQLNVGKTRIWPHFIPFVLWLAYCMFHYTQPDAVKFNDSIDVMHLNIPRLEEHPTHSDDPLGIRQYVNILTGIYFSLYTLLGVRILWLKAKSLGENLWNTSNSTLTSIRNITIHIILATLIFIVVKIIFKDDVGDHFIYLYLTFMIFMTAVQMMNKSTYYDEVSTFLQVPSLKYQKSSLSEEDKHLILDDISKHLKEEKYHLRSSASLSGLAKQIHQSTHHVSQVINEEIGLSFFELLAKYRVEEAMAILSTDLGKKLTIEEIAERVGYNSKSAFNTAFKKITQQTPSQYRDS